MIETGLELLLRAPPVSVQGKRLGLLTNQASVGRNLVHNRILLHNMFGGKLTALFAPQHGFYSEKQDNMIESGHDVDRVTGLPVYSLYGEVRKPEPRMLNDIDVLIVDLVDVGTRVYTFLYTMAYCLEAAAQYGKKVVVLDRPNPLGGVMVEGNVLEDDYRSFVGMYPLPMRHGMTFAELARMINIEHGIGADLEVVAMQGWKRRMLFQDTGLPWLFPSPNMPTPMTAMVYPGQVIWEGTNLSEGRGTTLPFELFGAPFVNHEDILEAVSSMDLPGCFLRPLFFEPTSGKWAKQVCKGFQIHVTDAQKYLPYRTSLALLQAVIQVYPRQFRYKEPPYEYEFKRLPMDLILGSSNLRRDLAQGVAIGKIEASWQSDLSVFRQKREKYLLYDL